MGRGYVAAAFDSEQLAQASDEVRVSAAGEIPWWWAIIIALIVLIIAAGVVIVRSRLR
jgi:hypothetical protein